jgi:hypothetical protein
MNGEPVVPNAQVREYAGPVILVGLVILAGLGIGLIWGLDPRWLYSASVVFVLAFVLAAAGDARRKGKAQQRLEQEALDAYYETARKAMDGPFGDALLNFSKLNGEKGPRL